MAIQRRTFIGRTLTLGGGLLAGCGDDVLPILDMGVADAGFMDLGNPDLGTPDSGIADLGPTDTGVMTCANPFEGGSEIGRQGFTEEDGVPLNRLFNQGWDGRRYTDLSIVDQDNLITPTDRFYVRTRYPDLLQPPARWSIAVNGMATPTDIFLDELLPMERDMGAHVLECSGNSRGGAFGLLSAGQWAGIPLSEVFDRLTLEAGATRVRISGFDEHSVPSRNNHSTPGAAWIFTLDELTSAGAFLATRLNGEALPPDHGQPVRLFVPNWYGCCCIKWVNEMSFVDDNVLATSQMREFASRTHQRGVPLLARDFVPATMDQAAMPVRVEKWRVEGQVVYRVVGVMWGGYEPTDKLVIRFNGGAAEAVDVCPEQTQNSLWTVWSHAYRPTRTGNVSITLEVDDRSIVTKRLDTRFYERVVRIDEV